MGRSTLVAGSLWVVFCLAYLTSTVRAAITPTGNVTPDNPASWGEHTRGYIGETANGGLTVDSGSSLKSWAGYIGYNAGTTGVATVNGKGSTWTNVGLYVGNYGDGTLNVTGGGTVNNSYNSYGCIGRWSGSTGVVIVDGSGSK